uniref:SP-RING-type domain-containing protein n=1 Tax=Kalanchoe fedtschenkoi TaxID=63787 RepID=A0A7N0V881_KALFE
MASTSSHRGLGVGVGDAIKTAANSISADSQTLIADIRKFLPVLREVAVDLEKVNEGDHKVKQLEEAMIELLQTSEDCACFSSALVSVGNTYQLTEEPTDFKKLLEEEMLKLDSLSSVPQNSALLRQFKESVWSVHHGGQLMPSDEQEDIVMTGTQTNLLNISCPLSGKPVIQLADPVRCVECKHIYEKTAIMQYIMTKRAGAKCPVAACPRVLTSAKVLCDPLLLVEIEEMRRSKSNQADRSIEDFTALDEEG